MSELWRNHSLTIVLAVIGWAMLLYSLTLEDGRWLDLWMGLGNGVLTVAVFYFFSRYFRETTKPED